MTAIEMGIILHELGHVLGLRHEHQSPARGGKITLKDDGMISLNLASNISDFCEAVLKYFVDLEGWDVDEVRSQILALYNETDLSNYSELDLESVMM